MDVSVQTIKQYRPDASTTGHASARLHLCDAATSHLPLSHTELVLIRGLPGSGKSTMASVLASVGYMHYEADQYFVVDGRYRYDSTRVQEAHAWCKAQTRQALLNGKKVVVSNTFTRLSEMEAYRGMSSNVRVIEARGRWENVHGVPDEMLSRMAQRWEQLSS